MDDVVIDFVAPSGGALVDHVLISQVCAITLDVFGLAMFANGVGGGVKGGFQERLQW